MPRYMNCKIEKMLFVKNIALVVVTVCFCSFQSEDAEFEKMKDIAAFRTKMDKVTAATSTIKASFQQEKYMSILANKMVSEGSMEFKKPNLLRWEYQQPFEYGIILNGKEMGIKDEGNTSSFDIGSSQTFQQINELIIQSVQGNVLNEERFDVTYLESKTLYLTKLIPKEAQLTQFLKGIDIYFDKGDFTVSKIRLIETEEDYTLISFSNKKMNEQIPDEHFSIK